MAADSSMSQARAFRLTIPDLVCWLSQDAVAVVNISQTGALLRVPRPVALNSIQHLGLRVHEQQVELHVRVARIVPSTNALLHRIIAVQFLAPTNALARVRAFLTPVEILAKMRAHLGTLEQPTWETWRERTSEAV